jgi:hypothetical protein
MGRRRHRSVLAVAIAGCLASAAACTGDDPVFATNADVDGGMAAADTGTTTGEAAVGSETGSLVDSGTPSCFRAPFTNVALSPLSRPGADNVAITFTADENTVYASATSLDAGTHIDIFTAQRPAGGTFPALVPFTLLDTDLSEDYAVAVNGASTELVFTSSRPPAQNMGLYFVTRGSAGAQFMVGPQLVQGLDTADQELRPFFAGGDLYFSRGTTTSATLMRAHESGTPGTFDVPVPVLPAAARGPVDLDVVLSEDRLVMYFGSSRGASFDIWMSTRAHEADDFGMPIKLTDPGLNTANKDRPAWLSPDGCRMYIITDREHAGRSDIWLATRTPL